MKIRLLSILTIFLFALAAHSAVPYRTAAPAIPPDVPDYLKTENFIKLSPRQFGEISGQKLNFIERLYFRKLKRKLQRSDYNATSNVLEYYDTQKARFRFDTLWFILGCMIGPFAVLFSLTVKDRTKNKKISALLGLSVFILWFGWMFLF